MGEYIYKVTGKKKTLADGTKANIAVFAYKPSTNWDDTKFNNQLYYKSGCYNADKYVKENPNYTGRVVLGESGEVAVPCKDGIFSDNWFDWAASMPKVE